MPTTHVHGGSLSVPGLSQPLGCDACVPGQGRTPARGWPGSWDGACIADCNRRRGMCGCNMNVPLGGLGNNAPK